MSWVIPYLHQQWTEQTDCYYWFARIQREVFNRHVADKPNPIERHNWQKATLPYSDGDAVIMYSNARDTRLSHIGTWCSADGGGVVHAQTGGRVCFDSLATLQQTQWKIREVLTNATNPHQ